MSPEGGIGIGVGIIKLYEKVFFVDVMGKVLSGELSFMWTDLIYHIATLLHYHIYLAIRLGFPFSKMTTNN